MINIGGIRFAVQIDARQAIHNLNQVNAQLNNMRGRFRAGGQAASRNKKKVDDFSKSVAGLASAFALVKIQDFVKKTVLLSARVENLGTVLKTVGLNAGQTGAQLRLTEEQVRSLGITTRQTRQALAQMAQANLDLRNSFQLARIAQNAAVIAGINSSDAFERLIVSIQRNDVRLLRNLGIVINLNNVYREFSQQTGRTANSLSSFEKRQLLLNKVIQRGVLIQGAYESAMQDVFKRYTSLDRKVEEAQLAFGQQFIPIMEKAVDGFTKLLEKMDDADSEFTQTAGSAAVFGTTFASIAAAVTGATSAFGALKKVVGLKGALVLTGLATAGGIVAERWFDAERAIFQAAEAIKEVGEQGEAASLKLAKQRNAIEAIAILSESFESAETKTEKLTFMLRNLADAFPEAAGRISTFVRNDDSRGLESFLRDQAPRALETFDEKVRQSKKNLFLAATQIRALADQLATGNAGQIGPDGGFETFQITTQQRDEIKFLLDAFQEGSIDLRLMQENLMNLELPESVLEQIQTAVLNFAKLRGEVKGFETAASQININDFADRLKALDQSGQIAAEAIKKAENQLLKQLKGTGAKQLQETFTNLTTLENAIVATENEIRTNAAARRKIELAALKENSRVQITILGAEAERATAAGNYTEAAKIRAKIAKEVIALEDRIAAKESEITEEEEGLIEKLERLETARAKTTQAFEALLTQQEGVIDGLELEAKVFRADLDPAIATVVSRIQAVTKTNEVFVKSLEDQEKPLLDMKRRFERDLYAINQQLLTYENDERFLEQKAVTIRKLEALDNKLALVSRLRANNEQKTALQIANYNQELTNKLTSEYEKRQKEITSLTSKIARLRGFGEFTATDLDEAESNFKTLQVAIEDLDSYFTRFETNRKSGGAAQIIFGIREEVDRFTRLAKGAVTKADIRKIENIFPKVIQERIKAARDELKKFKDEQRSGQLSQANADQGRFAELLDQGYTENDAIRKLQFEQSDRAKAEQEKEKQLKKNVRDAEKAGFEAQAEIKQVLKDETELIPMKNELMRETLRLRDEELVRSERQLAIENERLRVAQELAMSTGITVQTNAVDTSGVVLTEKQQRERTEIQERFNRGQVSRSFNGLVTASGNTTAIAPGLEDQLSANGSGDTVLSAAMKSTLSELSKSAETMPSLLNGVSTLTNYMIKLNDEVLKAAGAIRKVKK